MMNRNDPLGFVERTRKNLEFIEAARATNADVHVVAQLILSLLGLIVFPIEGNAFSGSDGTPLSELETAGWPTWHFEVGHSETLEHLLKHLRHATAHRNVFFSSDARDLDGVRIQFWNVTGRPASIRWKAAIEARDLREFCRRLSDHILER